jgi:putative DNA primase/helicase
MDTFMATTGDRHPTDLAKLHGARLVTAVETEDGRRWAESKLKGLTGGDKITARFMRQDFFEYTPQFKLVVAGNHKPAIRNVDEAMRRRIHLIPFTVTIPVSERDQQLTEKLIAELPGILAWAIVGCMEWQNQGLNPSESVRSATQEYLAAEDVLGRWMEENTVLGQQYFSSSSALYDDWRQWCEVNREYVGSQKQFSQKLEQRSEVTKGRREQARGFQGIALRTDASASTAG